MSAASGPSEAAVPSLPKGVRLKFDEARQEWLLLAPERVLKLDPVAAEILKRVDGTASVGAIVDALAEAFKADREQIATDVRAFLGQIAEKRMLQI